MSTWHQQRNGARLYGPKWRVVIDPPGRCMSIVTFEAAADAQAYLARLDALGKGEHAYMLAPAG